MNLTHLFRSYELLVDKAEMAFQSIGKDHSECINCERHCADCCHAVFGLFLIEAVYIKKNFDRLDVNSVQQTLLQCNDMDRALRRLEIRLQKSEEDPQMQAYILARERIRCPLLNRNLDCILYQYRPITCRVYGIPTKISGKAHVCGKAGFIKGETYPVFDLDSVYRDLFLLSKELLNEAGGVDSDDRAALLLSISKIIQTPLNDLIKGDFKQ
jgi:Fe-S-cluster containining protein